MHSLGILSQWSTNDKYGFFSSERWRKGWQRFILLKNLMSQAFLVHIKSPSPSRETRDHPPTRAVHLQVKWSQQNLAGPPQSHPAKWQAQWVPFWWNLLASEPSGNPDVLIICLRYERKAQSLICSVPYSCIPNLPSAHQVLVAPTP